MRTHSQQENNPWGRWPREPVTGFLFTCPHCNDGPMLLEAAHDHLQDHYYYNNHNNKESRDL